MKRLGLVLILACAPVGAAPDNTPPATLLTGTAVHGVATDPVLALVKLDRMSCTFSEEKHIALLARPLKSNGTIVFDRTKGVARTTLAPKRESVVLTPTTLRMKSSTGHSEEVQLDKSKDLRAFATVFPTLLRGDRKELETAFELGAYGGTTDWWALTLTPKSASLRGLLKQVTVIGNKSALVSLQITEASGDTTETKLAEIKKNGDVADSEITAAFSP